jgi:hypothetical protein
MGRDWSTTSPAIPSVPIHASPPPASPLNLQLLTFNLPLFNSFSCNIYGPPRKCCKQKTYVPAKLFRFNTYKNRGRGRINLPRSVPPRLCGRSQQFPFPELPTRHFPQFLSFHALTDSLPRRRTSIFLPLNHFRTLFIATVGVPPLVPFRNSQSYSRKIIAEGRTLQHFPLLGVSCG